MSHISDYFSQPPARLACADGTVFRGYAIGVPGEACAELVFNTSMTGYQEILTDPSYANQIVAFTYPHIGSVGSNADDMESGKIHAAGLVVRDMVTLPENWRSTHSLQDFLCQHQVTGISGVDTRMLTRMLRDKGSMNVCISTQEAHTDQTLIFMAKQQQAMTGQDLTERVSCASTVQWTTGSWQTTALAQAYAPHVVVMDFGVKQQICRLLVDRGCTVTCVPAKTTADELLALEPDGILLSNGPGDPEACHDIIATIQTFNRESIPTLGICLGFQLLALAYGAKSYKMSFGHHGANHPVQCLQSGKVFVTSQNHGFAIDSQSLPKALTPTHISLFDQSLQGFASDCGTVIGFQGHPEASPGPEEIQLIFDQFLQAMFRRLNAKTH